tara:strand:+ start:161471 stop:162040 length:570 start_codon:yes stop_codon:yes gene_type:complete
MEDNFFRVVAIDPALDKLGIAVLDVNLITKQIHIRYAETIDAVAGSQKYPEVISQFGLRQAKLCYHETYLTDFFLRWEPHAIVHEAPFLGRFPQSYAALVEAVSGIRRAAIAYNVLVDFDHVDPPSAKKAVGVNGKSKDKEEVMEAITKLPDVVYDTDTNILLSYLSEHASDAVAVGYWKIRRLFDKNL